MQQFVGGAHTLRSGETNVLAHIGLRPLWPVMLFAPWLVLGVACLLQAMRNGRGRASDAVR